MTKEEYVWRGHKVRIIDTWVDPDNNRKGVTIEPIGNYGFPIDVYLDEFKKVNKGDKKWHLSIMQ